MTKVRVLLVDDHIMMREGTKFLLSQEKSIEIVGEASDGAEALELIERLQPDLIIFDINMPRLNGVELAKTVAERIPRIKMLVLTAYNDVIYLRTMLKFGISGFVSKNASGRELVEAVQAIQAGRLALPPNLSESDDTFNDRLMEIRLARLSAREVEVLRRLINSERNTQIAEDLSISPKTLETHIRNIYNKLEIESRSRLLVNRERWEIVLSQFPTA